MLRITLPSQQVSKRLVAKLASMSGVKGATATNAKGNDATSQAMEAPAVVPPSRETPKSTLPRVGARAAVPVGGAGVHSDALRQGTLRAATPIKPSVAAAAASVYETRINAPAPNIRNGEADGQQLPQKKPLRRRKRLIRVSTRRRVRQNTAKVPEDMEEEPIVEDVEDPFVDQEEHEEEPVAAAPREKRQQPRPERVKGRPEAKTVDRQPEIKKTEPSPAASYAAYEHDRISGTSLHGKTPMIKAFRIEDVLAACTPSDGVFARRLPQGGCQFFAWPGTPLAVASSAVANMPETIRTVHAIFGREKTPMDLVLDIDCPVPQEHWSMSKVRPFQKKVLDDVMNVIVEEIEAIGEEIESQVVLQSPNLKKVSFHVHTKLKDAAFEDYNSLHGFLHQFHKRIPAVDLQIYRSNGMLRMHRCMKENHTSAIVVFEDKDWNIGFPDGIVPDAKAALHSACIREEGTYSRLLHFDPPRNFPTAFENSGANGSGAAEDKKIKVLLPRTEREAVENASRWLREGTREADVDEWRSWIRLGINAYRVAYHFRDAMTLQRPALEELLDAWVEASKKCPAKFKPGVCEARWATFDINRLSKFDDNEWWPSYQRIGRTAMLNEAADAANRGGANGIPPQGA
ncbi:mitochondrial DNA primase [Trypanosoma brucei equiperdum]|uniref:Mitochondrial DNA primase n=1 Tax=Trypanosoma brucei equiperdum TaxID=630700 RepID=A0A3L6L422_9TRYP|nr:mitochondrial DNA primase [Trypanosoma brucei equiperdum]